MTIFFLVFLSNLKSIYFQVFFFFLKLFGWMHLNMSIEYLFYILFYAVLLYLFQSVQVLCSGHLTVFQSRTRFPLRKFHYFVHCLIPLIIVSMWKRSYLCQCVRASTNLSLSRWSVKTLGNVPQGPFCTCWARGPLAQCTTIWLFAAPVLCFHADKDLLLLFVGLQICFVSMTQTQK